ncbi:Cation/H+ exchanger [Trinorchestia longiramus]|nr:Cation/H+ exchanger [Trinorchestia longiramus]
MSLLRKNKCSTAALLGLAVLYLKKSATSDTIIFMFLGMVLVHDRHVWQTGFVLWTLILCFVIRLIVTLILAVVTNRHRLHPIGIAEQLVLAYGGLRGAVAFSLVSMMPGTFEHKELFITATLVVILFTVFVQGITVGPMVTFLNVALTSTGPQHLLQEVNVKVVDTMMAGIEEVIGRMGDNKVRESLKSFNDKYFMKWLTIPSNEDRLTKVFEKIAITEHYANLYGPNLLIEKAKEELTASRQDLTLGLSPYGSHISVTKWVLIPVLFFGQVVGLDTSVIYGSSGGS